MEYRLKENPNGMVSKEVFVKKIKELALMFPTWKMDLTNNQVIGLLYKNLGYTTNKAFSDGIDKYIKTETYNPTVATLSKYINSVDKREPEKIKVVLFDHEIREGGSYLINSTEHEALVFKGPVFVMVDGKFYKSLVYNNHIERGTEVKEDEYIKKIETYKKDVLLLK